MILRITLAALHLLALAIGLSAIDGRARHLRAIDPGAPEPALRRAFASDTWWGIAAVLWISTGLWRWLGGTEKSAGYYFSNHIFLAKMGFLLAILALELWPMVTLVRWRIAAGRGTLPAAGRLVPIARRISTISYVQLALTLAMLVAAVMMARGYGAG